MKQPYLFKYSLNGDSSLLPLSSRAVETFGNNPIAVDTELKKELVLTQLSYNHKTKLKKLGFVNVRLDKSIIDAIRRLKTR